MQPTLMRTPGILSSLSPNSTRESNNEVHPAVKRLTSEARRSSPSLTNSAQRRQATSTSNPENESLQTPSPAYSQAAKPWDEARSPRPHGSSTVSKNPIFRIHRDAGTPVAPLDGSPGGPMQRCSQTTTPSSASRFIRSLSRAATDSPRAAGLAGASGSPIHIGEFFNAMAVMKDNVAWFEDRFAEMAQSPPHPLVAGSQADAGDEAAAAHNGAVAENCFSQLRVMELAEQVDKLEDRLASAYGELGVMRELNQRSTERIEATELALLNTDFALSDTVRTEEISRVEHELRGGIMLSFVGLMVAVWAAWAALGGFSARHTVLN